MEGEFFKLLTTPSGQAFSVLFLYCSIKWLIKNRTEDKTDLKTEIEKIHTLITDLDNKKTDKETCRVQHKSQDARFERIEDTLSRIEKKLDNFIMKKEG